MIRQFWWSGWVLIGVDLRTGREKLETGIQFQREMERPSLSRNTDVKGSRETGKRQRGKRLVHFC